MLERHSLCHRCQKWGTRHWQRCQWRSIKRDLYESWGFGRAVIGFPIKKWPGVSTSIPSSLKELIGTSGRLLRHASTCARIVENSSNVSLTGEITHLRWSLTPFTADSHIPPKWGDLSGMYFHCIPRVEQSEIAPWVIWWLRKAFSSFSSWLAPTKLVPWSLQISDGWPRRAVNLHNAAMKDLVVSTDFHCQTYKEADIGLQDSWLPHVSVFDLEGTCIVDSNLCGDRSRSNLFDR